MFFPAQGRPTRIWRALVAVSLLAVPLTERIAIAFYPGVEEINAAVSANDESLRAIATCLALGESKLKKLIELQIQGHAAWREVAEQQVGIESLQAEWKAAKRFSAFTSALRERAEWSQCHENVDATSASRGSRDLPTATLHVAAAQAQSCSALDAAKLAVRRKQIHVTALEQLRAQGFASDRELSAARQNLQAAESLAEQLTAKRLADLQFYEALLKSAGQAPFDDCALGLADNELPLEELPPRFFVSGDCLRRLLELRKDRGDMEACSVSISAEQRLLEELLRRLSNVQQRSDGMEREIELARLNLAHKQAQRLAAGEQVTILRLEEIRFVAQCLDQLPRQDATRTPQLHLLATTRTELEADSRSAIHAGRPLWFATAPQKPAPRDLSISSWSNGGRLAAASATVSESSNLRFSDPWYCDFYAFGIRRRDLPAAMSAGFFCGGLPWYLPGSSTNFK